MLYRFDKDGYLTAASIEAQDQLGALKLWRGFGLSTHGQATPLLRPVNFLGLRQRPEGAISCSNEGCTAKRMASLPRQIFMKIYAKLKAKGLSCDGRYMLLMMR